MLHALGVHCEHGVRSGHGQRVANGRLGRQQGIEQWWRCIEGPVGEAARLGLPPMPQPNLGVHWLAFGENEGGRGRVSEALTGGVSGPFWAAVVHWLGVWGGGCVRDERGGRSWQRLPRALPLLCVQPHRTWKR
jgi:hypothetical protein